MKVSNTRLKRFNFSLYEKFKKNNLISLSGKHAKIMSIKMMNMQLLEGGYGLKNIYSFKEKHVRFLVEKWKNDDLSSGRIKNLLSDLRFLSHMINKKTIVKSNDYYEINSRSIIATENKAVHQVNTDAINSEILKASLDLQKAFGLRREECLKFKPHMADKGDLIKLKKSWTKGNVGRIVPITCLEQRKALNHAKSLVNENESMIPKKYSYVKYKNFYDNQVKKSNNKNLHGLRHAYAQNRYEEITGWKSPICGGKQLKDMNSEERKKDIEARKVVSLELGHARLQITRAYLG